MFAQSATAQMSLVRSPSQSPLLQPRRATTSRPTRGAPLRVCAQKGKGKRYRKELNDPYAGEGKKAAEKKPPKQTAEAGPINAVFTDDEETEEYFLFVRKVRVEAKTTTQSEESASGGGGGGGGGDVESGTVEAVESIEARRERRSQQMGKRNKNDSALRPTEGATLQETKGSAGGDGVAGGADDSDGSTSSSSSSSSSLDVALAGLGMRGPSASSAAAKSTKQLGAWLPLGDVVVRAGGDVDVVVAERRGILTRFAKRKHLKMLPVAADEVLEFGVRVQRAPPRGPDLTEVFPVAHEAPHADLVWDHRAMGDLGAERAELRLMNAMPTISSHKKNEMLSSAMGMIKAQQEKAAAAAASPPPSSEQANDA